MIYSYECEDCGKHIEKDFNMGTAKKTIKCICGKKAIRVYNFGTCIPNPTHEAREGRGQSKR